MVDSTTLQDREKGPLDYYHVCRDGCSEWMVKTADRRTKYVQMHTAGWFQFTSRPPLSPPATPIDILNFLAYYSSAVEMPDTQKKRALT